jgi:uncharacterized protein
MPTEFTPLSGLLGGLLIGLASTLLLLANGRIAGISGIVAGLLSPTRGDLAWRVLFVGGLILGGVSWPLVTGRPLPFQMPAGLATVGIAGFLVGFGTRMGGGCTSGHGVCGIARGAKRSVVATVFFMATAMVTTFVVRIVTGE